MLELWGRKNSNQVIQVMWTLAELDLSCHRYDVGGSFGGLDTADYLALNPNRKIPTLRDDGFVLWESNAIVRYLARQYGMGVLCPVDPRQAALAEQWMEWSNDGLMATFFPVFWGLVRTPACERNLADIQQRVEQTAKLLKVLDQHLSEYAFVAGDQLSFGDIPLGVVLHKYFALPIERPDLPNLQRWYQTLCARAAYQQHAMADFGRSPEEWLALEKASAQQALS